MTTINLTERDAANLLTVLRKVIDKERVSMLGERRITPTYDEITAAMGTACQIMKQNNINPSNPQSCLS